MAPATRHSDRAGLRGLVERLDGVLGSRRLGRELALLQRTFDAVPDGWMVLSDSGVVATENDAARRLLGMVRGDRRTLVEVARDPAVDSLMAGEVEDGIVEIASPIDESTRLELRHIRADGGQSIVLVRDVTTLNRLLTMRQDFIANVSHELRTPLTVIVGYLETLEDDDIDLDTMRRLLNRLHAPAERMKALVDDLLTLTRLESSPMPGPDDVEVVKVAAMVDSIVAEARQLAGPGHEFHIDVDPDLCVPGVPTELHSACFNLVANAIRYSPDGGPIHVRWRASDEGPRFEVEDAGQGIAAEHISRLTERFFRVDLADSRARGGTGLGLAIVKHVLRRHNSQLGVASEVGEGSVFHFVLPAIRASESEAAQPA